MRDRTHTRWTPVDWISLTGVLAFIVCCILYVMFPTSRFYDQISMSITRETNGQWIVNSQRRLPWGSVSVEWDGEVTVVGREKAPVCTSSGKFTAQVLDVDLRRYPANDWMIPCLLEGPPTSITFVRQVILWDRIPLIPDRYTFVINPENVPIVSQGE